MPADSTSFVPLSVLDPVPVSSSSTATAALRNTGTNQEKLLVTWSKQNVRKGHEATDIKYFEKPFAAALPILAKEGGDPQDACSG